MTAVAVAAAGGFGNAPVCRILIVDDARHIARLIQVHLERAGFEADCVDSGKDALNKIKQEQYDLAILDITMPSPDGYEILAYIRSEPSLSQMRVILKHPFPDDWEYIRAYEAGAGVLITVKVKPMELLSFIKRIFSLSDP